jgi:anti-anti-sigma factor
MALQIQVETNPGVDRTARVRLHGRLDTSTAPQLETALQPLLDGSIDNLILDLAALEFISSAGLRVLVQTRKTMRARKGGVLMVNAQPQILKVFDIIKALPDVAIFQSDAELDVYLAQMQRRVREQQR